MSTIAENLQKLIDIKADIKSAIKGKGVEVSDSDKFETYPSLISSIPQGSGGGGDCDPDHYLEYEYVEVSQGCDGDDLTSHQQPQVTINDEQYMLEGFPDKVVMIEKNNNDCICHQLLCRTPEEGESYTFKVNASRVETAYDNVGCYVGDSDEWTSTRQMLDSDSNVKEVLRLPLFPNITTCERMFQSNTKLTYINLGESLKNAKPTSMEWMFYNVRADIDGLENIDTSECISFSYIFGFGGKEDVIFDNNIYKWNTSKCQDFSNMFYNNKIQKVDLTGFDFSSATSVKSMFNSFGGNEIIVDGINFNSNSNMAYNDIAGTSALSKLTTLKATNCSITNNYLGTSYMPFGDTICKAVTEELDLSGFRYIPTSSTQTYNLSFFLNSAKCKNLFLRDWDFSELSSFTLDYFLSGIQSEIIDLSNWLGTEKFNFTGTNKLFLTSLPNLKELHLNGWNLEGTNFEESKIASCPNLSVIYVCGCSDETINKIQAIVDASGLSSQITVTKFSATGDWRWSSDIDTLCKNQKLYSVHYKEYEYGCEGNESEWRKDYSSEYQVVSITDDESCRYSIALDLNNQWQELTENVSAPDGMEGAIFESFSNYHIAGISKTRIYFDNIPNLKIWIKSETNNQDTRYDYTIASKLDTDLPTTYSSSMYSNASVQYYTYNVNGNPWVECDYSNDGGLHYIEVAFVQDSGFYGLDKGFVFIPYDITETNVKTGQERYSDNVTFCDGMDLKTVQYKEYEYLMPNLTYEWRRDLNDYNVISTEPNSEECLAYVKLKINDNQWHPLTNTDLSKLPLGYDSYEDAAINGRFFESEVADTSLKARLRMRIVFKGIPDFTIQMIHSGYVYNYVLASKLDTELPSNAQYTNSAVQQNTRGKTSTFTSQTYENDGEEHFIDVEYYASSTSTTATGLIYLPYTNVRIEE